MSIKTDADVEAVFAAIAEGRPIDPEVARRVQERSAKLRKTFDEELSVKLIREIRDEQ